MDFKLGIQSYCFRHFLSIPELIDALQQAGLSCVEIWPGHLGWDWEANRREVALVALAEKGIAVTAYGAVDFGVDETQARAVFGFARSAGIEAVTTTWIDPAAYPLVERMGEAYGIKVAIHNHGRGHHYGTFEQVQAVFDATSPRVGLCLDTAWFLDAGCDPVEAVDRFGERLYGVHLKDFVFDDEGGHEDVIIGTGGLDLPAFVRRLRDVGFDGYLSIEYEGDPEDPVPQVKACVRAAQDAIRAL